LALGPSAAATARRPLRKTPSAQWLCARPPPRTAASEGEGYGRRGLAACQDSVRAAASRGRSLGPRWSLRQRAADHRHGSRRSTGGDASAGRRADIPRGHPGSTGPPLAGLLRQIRRKNGGRSRVLSFGAGSARSSRNRQRRSSFSLSQNPQRPVPSWDALTAPGGDPVSALAPHPAPSDPRSATKLSTPRR